MKRIKIFVSFALLALTLATCSFAAGFTKSKTYNSNFSDVSDSQWYADSVKQVYELSLMEGVSEGTFDTESEMNVAQAITIAARLHSIYNGTETPRSVGGAYWYADFVSYCKKYGIISENQFDSYNRSVLSYEMVQLFASALPEDFFPEINDITYIQDVPESEAFYGDVLLFYKAGVLNGNDKYGTFLPMSAITRKRAAVILSRTVLPEKRLTYSLQPKRESYNVNNVLSIIDAQTVKGTLDEITLVSTQKYKISAAEYRYYSYLEQNGSAQSATQQMRSTASIVTLLKDMELEVSYEALGEILSMYYATRTESYGTSTYYDALEAQKLSDSVFARLIAINELYYQGIKMLGENVSESEAFEYANENNYICAKQIFISKDSTDAYKTALSVRLSLADGADFDELLAQYGQDAGMKARKDGYYFAEGWMVKEFEDASYSLDEGEISDVVESELGYHIIKRMPMTKEGLTQSPEYSAICANCGSDTFYSKLSEKQNEIVLTYSENFDGLSALLR